MTRHLRQLAPGERAACVAVLAEGEAEALAAIRREVAARDGALVPVIDPDPASGRYPLHRLCGERVLTVNTAAAGGNAALMTLAVQGVSAGGLPLHGPVIGGG